MTSEEASGFSTYGEPTTIHCSLNSITTGWNRRKRGSLWTKTTDRRGRRFRSAIV